MRDLDATKRFNDGLGGFEVSNIELVSSIANAMEAAKHLPIVAKKREIMEKLEKNKVLIVSGDTGCGKTTQVPKYILEHAMHNK